MTANSFTGTAPAVPTPAVGLMHSSGDRGDDLHSPPAIREIKHRLAEIEAFVASWTPPKPGEVSVPCHCVIRCTPYGFAIDETLPLTATSLSTTVILVPRSFRGEAGAKIGRWIAVATIAAVLLSTALFTALLLGGY